jgi:beta-galactosidase
VRNVLPHAVVTSHAEIPGLMAAPRWDGTPDDRKMAESVDYYGASMYPKHAGARVPWTPLRRAVGFDFTRSMNFKHGGFYVGELQAGYGVFGLRLGLPVTAEDLRDWMWTAVATGAKAINIYAYYPMSAGYESGGYGLVELDGKLTARAQAAGAVARVIARHQDFFLAARPARAEIAILYNPLANFVGGQQTFIAGGQTVGANNLSESLQGVYRAYYENNIPIDFVHLMDASAAHLAGYKLVIAPYPVLMPKAAIKELIEYVRAGGTLVAEARAGWNDERGFASEVIPGGGLHEVCSCREVETKPIERQSRITIKESHAALPLLKTGDALEALFFEESFDLRSERARVLAAFSDGQPALVYSTFGRGRALVVGSFIGSAYYHFSHQANARFFTGLAEWLGVKPAVQVTSSVTEVLIEARVLERRMGSRRERVLVCFNRGARETQARFTLEATERAAARDLETGAAVRTQAEAGRLTLEWALRPQEVWVVRVEEGSGG